MFQKDVSAKDFIPNNRMNLKVIARISKDASRKTPPCVLTAGETRNNDNFPWLEWYQCIYK